MKATQPSRDEYFALREQYDMVRAEFADRDMDADNSDLAYQVAVLQTDINALAVMLDMSPVELPYDLR